MYRRNPVYKRPQIHTNPVYEVQIGKKKPSN